MVEIRFKSRFYFFRMKTKQQKVEGLRSLKDKLNRSEITIFTSFAAQGKSGLSVGDMQSLRKSLKESEGEYVVEKKSIVKRALDKKEFSDVDTSAFEGSIGTVLGYDDAVSTAKVVYEFSKDNEALTLFGAMFDGQYLDKDQLVALAKIPGREVLLGQLVSMLSYPMRGLVTVLQGNIRGLAAALNQIAQQKAN